jgi:hypothetical protein
MAYHTGKKTKGNTRVCVTVRHMDAVGATRGNGVLRDFSFPAYKAGVV